MIMPSDKDYQETKQLKKSGLPLASPFREIADWIASEYGVQVLNVRYEILAVNDRPRLNVILEWDRDAEKFRDRTATPGLAYMLCNFDHGKQDRVLQQFKRLLVEQNIQGIVTDRMFVIFSSFEAAATIEANEMVTESDLDRLKQRLANPDLWLISRWSCTATFFFYTSAQAEEYEAKGLREVYTKEYLQLVKPWDEFGYITQSAILVRFDSKQNFDTNYQSNWFYYRK